MATQPDEFPPYDAACPPLCGVDAGIAIEVEYDACEDGGVTVCWDYEPAFCDRRPQGYYIYRTTIPPVTGSESLCMSLIGEPELEDRSSWKHTVNMYTGTLGTTPIEPVFTNKTPYGVVATQSSINLYRAGTPPSPPLYTEPNREKEHIRVSGTDRFDFRDEDFTIEFWAGNLETPWLYYFPCQTLISAFDSSVNKRGWRIYIEPRSVTLSVSPGTRCGTPGSTPPPPGCSIADQQDGTLVVEFYENGDGSGSTIKQNIMNISSNPADWRTSPTGRTNRFGYMHISVLREGGILKVYVDGVLRSSIAMPWFVAWNNQPVVIGRHFGNSGRLDAGQFNGSIPVDDGEESHFHGCIYDLRIVKGHAVIPPPGGQPPDLCQRPVWFSLFTKMEALPPGVKCWKDPNPPIGDNVYYRVAAVNCDVEIAARCPSYIKAKINGEQQMSNLWVSTSADLAVALNKEPPTLQDIFNDWDRSNPWVRGEYYIKGVGAIGEHADWYFDSGLESFVQPTNSSRPVHIVSPESYYQTSYIHEVVLKSNNADDDTVGVCGAYSIDDVGDHWSLVFARTNAGQPPHKGWGAYVLGPGYNGMSTSIPSYDSCGMQVGPVSPNGSYPCSKSTSGSNGWSGKTTSVMVKRDSNSIRAWCSEYGTPGQTERGDHRPEASWPEHGGVYDSAALIDIDFNSTSPPPGLADWSMFRDRPSGVGFMTWSQATSFYQDWFYYPPIGQRLFDFTNGPPGDVWEWSEHTKSWYKTLDTAWEVVGKTSTVISDPNNGLVTRFNCDGTLN
jgi:hypothetical protein